MLEAAGLIEGTNLYDIANTQVGPPPEPGPQGQQDVQAGHRLHRQGRQDRHHRRVHRPDDGRPALVGRPAPGGRGQGRRADRAGEPDARLDHLPELFPHVSEAVGHDRHGADRGAGILRHLPDERRLHPDQRAGPAASTRTTNSTRTSPTSSAPSPRKSSARQEKGQPVLVGTVSIEKSEMLSEYLEKEGIRHSVLNARFHESEAHIVAQAGRIGAVTIATNMAGRGTDIQLGGNLEFRIEDELPDVRRGRRNATQAIERIARRDRGREAARARSRRPVRARHRAPREPAHRQPAARPLGPPGRPRPVALLPEPRRRSAAHLRPADRLRAPDEQEPRGRRGDRLARGSRRRSRPRRRRSRRATTTSASRSSNSTT